MVVHPRLRVAIATALLQLSYKPTLRTLNGQSPLGQDAHRYRKSPQVSNGTSQNIETSKPRTISDRVSVTKVALANDSRASKPHPRQYGTACYPFPWGAEESTCYAEYMYRDSQQERDLPPYLTRANHGSQIESK
jgi:hypothetical protein